MQAFTASDAIFIPEGRRAPSEAASRALVLAALAMPVAVLAYLPGASADSALVWLVGVAMALAGVVRLVAGPAVDPARAQVDGPRMLSRLEIPDPVARAMDVRIALVHGGRREFRGPLKLPAAGLVGQLEQALDGAHAELGLDAELGARLVLTRPVAPRAGFGTFASGLAADGASVLLFLASALTTAFIGSVIRGGSPLVHPRELVAGLPFAAVVLSVFTAQALARTLALRAHGVRAGAPWFIPLPVPPGTAGGVVPARPATRAALFDAAFWGLAAGLAVAFGALAWGLRSSPVAVAGAGATAGVGVGHALALAFVAKLVLGPALAFGDHVVLSPVAAGAWLSLMVLTLRLLPVGGLDGGSMTRAMLGSASGRAIGRVARWTLLAVALALRTGALPWLIGAFVFAREPAPPRDDVTRPGAGRLILGALMFAVLFGLTVPLPDALYEPAGIHAAAPPAEAARGVGLAI